MLHALAEHGFTFLTNDNLIVYRDPELPALTGLPTYIKVRSEPADRFAGFLADRARRNPHNAGLWRRFQAGPAEFPFRGEAMLTPAGFAASRQPRVPLRDRELHVVTTEFVDAEPTVEHLTLSPAAAGGLLRGRLKWLAAPTGDAEGLLTAFACAAQFWRYRHRGDVALLLEALAPAPAPGGHR
jgi:hypothetical protein